MKITFKSGKTIELTAEELAELVGEKHHHYYPAYPQPVNPYPYYVPYTTCVTVGEIES